MRRAWRFLAILVVTGTAAWGLSQAPRALSRMEAFRVRDAVLEGARFLTTDEAVRWAELAEDASVWDDPSAWERRLRMHPLVEQVRVGRKLPGTLVFRVRERSPVALVPGPTLEPVDAEGEALPLDPAVHRMDLPVIQPRSRPEGRGLTPEELHRVAREVGRLEEVDPRFLASVSDVALLDHGAIAARLMEPRVEVWFRPPLTALRLREGLQALDDAGERVAPGAVERVDLRFEDQVVIRWSGSGSTIRQSD